MKLLLRGLMLALLLGSAFSLRTESSVLAVSPARQSDNVERISKESLNTLLTGKKKVVVIDVRDADSFKAGHIKGAVNIPYSDIETRFQELPKNRQIVTYCS